MDQDIRHITQLEIILLFPALRCQGSKEYIAHMQHASWLCCRHSRELGQACPPACAFQNDDIKILHKSMSLLSFI